MKLPIFVRELSKNERETLEAGLRSSDAFVLRRCQILLASSKGERPPRISENLGCASQTVRNAIHEFDECGLDALTPGSSRPKEVHASFDVRRYGGRGPAGIVAPLSEGVWQADEPVDTGVCSGGEFRGGPHRETGERGDHPSDPGESSARSALWKRAKRWIESPDPEYARKKGLSSG
jgi:hypothetical protein